MLYPLPIMLRAQEEAWAQGKLRIRVRGLGSQWEGEKGTGVSDSTPYRLSQGGSHSPQEAYLEPSQLRVQCRERSRLEGQVLPMVTNVHPFCEFLVELLTRLWLEMELRQQKEQKS